MWQVCERKPLISYYGDECYVIQFLTADTLSELLVNFSIIGSISSQANEQCLILIATELNT